MCFRVIRPKIISYRMKDFLFWLWSLFKSFSLDDFLHFSTFCFSSYISTFCRMVSHFFSFFFIFFHLPFNIGIPFKIWLFTIFDVIPLNICPSVWRVILDQSSKRKIIRLKRGNHWIIFQWKDRERWSFIISSIVT